jgi:hypothetical protein
MPLWHSLGTGFKAFIRTLQRELSEMRTEISDLQDKVRALIDILHTSTQCRARHAFVV